MQHTLLCGKILLCMTPLQATCRDENGNKTCYIYDNDSPGLMPMWDWIQNATYIGSGFKEDMWMWNVRINSKIIFNYFVRVTGWHYQCFI